MPRSRLIAELRKVAGRTNVLATPEDLVAYSRDATLLEQRPLAVVCPTSTQVVSDVVKLAGRYGTGVVCRSSGTGMAGGAVPVENSIVLSFTRMNRILEIDPINLTATVEPGVVNIRLREEVGRLGLMYPPDPYSGRQCAIGGNIGTNAAGSLAFKYGTTRSYVLGLEVVLGTGEVIHTGGKTVNAFSGYNLTQFFVGSEGTLGIVTQATLRLIPMPRASALLLAAFPSLEEAARAVTTIFGSGILPYQMDMQDRTTINCLENAAHAGLPTEAEALVIIGLDGSAEAVAQEAEQAARICSESGAFRVDKATTPEQKARILGALAQTQGSYARSAPTMFMEDVCVPRAAIANMIRTVYEIAGKHGLKVGIVGHAGDGNLHPFVLFDQTSPKDVEAFGRVNDEIFTMTIKMGGTLSGEHGVGLLKRDYLEMEQGAVAVETMRRLKRVFDPQCILNPGKIFTSGGEACRLTKAGE